MSLASSKSRPTAEPHYDLSYSIHDFEPDPRPDSQFLYRRIEESIVAEATVPGGRTLDVACGVGQIADAVTRRGGEGWGIDSSREMLGLNRWVFTDGRAVLVRAVAETLPLRDAAFDRVICQGSLDHFVEPSAFMREARRIARPDGRVVIALANYDSLSCRLGRLIDRIARLLRRPRPDHRLYWQRPLDHHHKGDTRFVRALGGPGLHLERWYGISLLWLLPGWGTLLAKLPAPVAAWLLRRLDAIAYRMPGLADMIVSVWRPRASP